MTNRHLCWTKSSKVRSPTHTAMNEGKWAGNMHENSQQRSEINCSSMNIPVLESSSLQRFLVSGVEFRFFKHLKVPPVTPITSPSTCHIVLGSTIREGFLSVTERVHASRRALLHAFSSQKKTKQNSLIITALSCWKPDLPRHFLFTHKDKASCWYSCLTAPQKEKIV